MSDTMNEETLFLRLKEVLIPDLEKASDEFSSFDCTSKILNAYIELKCRHTHYSSLLIEKSNDENSSVDFSRSGIKTSLSLKNKVSSLILSDIILFP